MISNSMHSVSPYLARSQQDYRAELQQRSQVQPDAPIEENDSPEEITPAPKDLSKLEENRQENRDIARQAAVQAVEIKQKEAMVEAYIKASSKTQESQPSVSTPIPEPIEVYQASLKYARREDLMTAFEAASNRDSSDPSIDIMV